MAVATKKTPTPQEQVKTLRSWLLPKEIQIREAQKLIGAQELYTKHLKEDIDSGFLIKQKKKEISEQMTDQARKLKELELAMLEKELDFGFLLKQADIIMEDLKNKLTLETSAVEEITKKITLIERNHKVEVKEEKKDE